MRARHLVVGLGAAALAAGLTAPLWLPDHVDPRLVAATSSSTAAGVTQASAPPPPAVPLAPAAPVAAASDSSVRLTWNGSAGATGYRVTLWNGTARIRSVDLGAARRSIIVPRLLAKHRYIAHLRVRNAAGLSALASTTFMTKPVRLGLDVSWPQCSRVATLPTPAFAIVGVNDGIEGTRNPCLSAELGWAARSAGGSTMPRVSYYVEAADPHTETHWQALRWPTTNRFDGHAIPIPGVYRRGLPSSEACTGARSTACAYVYGWETGWRDAHLAGIVAPGSRTWWLDVESPGVWNLANRPSNRAILEGMAQYLGGPRAAGDLGAPVGAYSTKGLWAQIVGPLRAGSPLRALENWQPAGAIGGGSRSAAIRRLHADAPFTPAGGVRVTQWTSGGLDHNYAPSR